MSFQHVTTETLTGYLAGELSAREKYDADTHFAVCPECAALLEQQRSFERKIIAAYPTERPAQLSHAALLCVNNELRSGFQVKDQTEVWNGKCRNELIIQVCSFLLIVILLFLLILPSIREAAGVEPMPLPPEVVKAAPAPVVAEPAPVVAEPAPAPAVKEKVPVPVPAPDVFAEKPETGTPGKDLIPYHRMTAKDGALTMKTVPFPYLPETFLFVATVKNARISGLEFASDNTEVLGVVEGAGSFTKFCVVILKAAALPERFGSLKMSIAKSDRVAAIPLRNTTLTMELTPELRLTAIELAVPIAAKIVELRPLLLADLEKLLAEGYSASPKIKELQEKINAL